MSVTGLDVFDATLQKTNSWLQDLMQALVGTDRREAYAALRATLHALRDQLTVEEATQLGAQLPLLIRGFYYKGWDPTGKLLRMRHNEEFLALIEWQFRDDGLCDDLVDPERVARVVFRVLAQRVSTGAIQDVRHVLPAVIRDSLAVKRKHRR